MKGSWNTVIVLLVGMVLGGCLGGKSSAEGSYGYVAHFECGYELKLLSDQTFVYHWQEGLNSGLTRGMWEQKGNQLIINSYTQPPLPTFVVEESLDFDPDSLYLEAVEIGGDHLSYVGWVLNDTLRLFSDMEGKVVIPNRLLRTLKVYYMTFGSLEHEVKNPAANHFKLLASPELPREVGFENQEGRLSARGLVLKGDRAKGKTRLKMKRIKERK